MSATGSFIDKFLIFERNLLHSGVVVTDSFSDHAGIKFNVNLPALPNAPIDYGTPTRLYHLTNRKRFNRTIGDLVEQLEIPVAETLHHGDCECLATVGEIIEDTTRQQVPVNKIQRPRIVLSTAVRALQSESKRLQRKLHRLGPAAADAVRSALVRDIRLLKVMAEAEFSNYFTSMFNEVTSIRNVP